MRAESESLVNRLLLFMVVVAVAAASAWAGTTGQIKGRVTDKKTKEGVPGATVLLVGTKQGAQADADGNYVIPRVEPGIYSLRISSIDYQTVNLTGIEVRADITNEQNVSMSSEAVDLGKEITVSGKQDIIKKFDVQNSVSIGAADIKSRPVQSVDNLLKSVAGVQATRQGEIFIRGGRRDEVAYIVDGVPITDPLGGQTSAGANLSLVSGSIQEIQVIKSGFDPEYGNALSGIVSIRSQVGSKDFTRFTAQYITDDFGNGDLNKYSRNQDYLRLTLSGPDPILSNRILPSVGLNFLKDQEFTYYLYAEVDKDDGAYQYDDYDTDKFKRGSGGFNLLGINVPERLNNRYNLQTNFRFRPQPNLKFTFSYKLWDRRWSDFSYSYIYTPNTATTFSEKRQSLSFEVTHELTKNFNYEAIVSYVKSDVKTMPGDPNRPGRGLNPDQMVDQDNWETFTDVNRNGVYDAPEPIINIFPDSAQYGANLTGPAYTFGEQILVNNVQGGGQSFLDFRFNNNKYIDNLEGEAYIDLNGNGVWDVGDQLNDKNGNGTYDTDRSSLVRTSTPEPFVDGDSVLGEPFTDVNGNGVYDLGIDIFTKEIGPGNQDLNRDGQHNGPGDPWTPGIPFYDRNRNGVYDLPNTRFDPGELYSDVNGNGRYDQGGASTFYDPGTYNDDIYWESKVVKTLRAEVKAVRTFGKHELKGGIAMFQDDFDFGQIKRPYLVYTGRPDGGAYPDRGAFRAFYSYKPIQGTFYLRDKLEYGSMIASLGLRLDYFLQDTKSLAENLRADDRGGTILGDRQKLSPRIGFSYPISDKAKVYFNYGHFFQLPTYDNIYTRNAASVDERPVLGDPNLDYQKTIQYSFGVKYAITETYAIDIQGYFKDEFDKINQVSVIDPVSRREYNQYANSDYGRSRGIEVTVEKRGSGYVNGEVSYTYAFAFGKASEAATSFLEETDLLRQPLDEAPLDNDIRHSLKANIQLVIPSTVRPRLFGLPIPNGWSLAVDSRIESGRPYTPDRSYPNLNLSGVTDPQRNSLRYPGTAFFDVRFDKDFKVAGLSWRGILWIENIFDSRNILSVYSNTGRADTDRNQNGVVLRGEPIDNNPENYDFGRQVRVGLEVSI